MDDNEKSNFWAFEKSEIYKIFNVDKDVGLSKDQVKRRIEFYGENKITSQEVPSWFVIFIRQFKGLLVALLVIASIIAGVSGDLIDTFAILLVLIINAVIGFITEQRALASMESLRQMGTTLTRVIREGQHCLLSSEELVPGDVLVLEAGDVVTADARIITCKNLSVDESALTGESVPVEKDDEVVLKQSTEIADRKNMLMKGTHITKGVAQAIVTNTGMKTVLGEIASLASKAEEEITPLEKRLDALGKKLVWVTLFVAFFIFVSGVLTGKDLVLMVQTAIALAVATVPEGLPIVATIALAKGLWMMAKKNALINRLSAVETLGATSIIVTDKTGTLTENKMTVSRVTTPTESYKVLPNEDSAKLYLIDKNQSKVLFSNMSSDLIKCIQVVGLCNDSQHSTSEEVMGDPMEVALLRFSNDILEEQVDLNTDYPRISEVPFDSDTKMMATFHQGNSEVFTAVKGAPEAVFECCKSYYDPSGNKLKLDLEKLDNFKSINEDMAESGLRVIAVAFKESADKDDVYKNLTFLGLVGLIDPARKGVPESVKQCQKAGIRIIMATGDQKGTAAKIAEDVGLPIETILPVIGAELSESSEWSEQLKNRIEKTSIFSRVSPEQKLQLITYFQKQGAVVAMTGDGVNDAPALKKADIGIAMGLRGTQVAREVSDMILKDDKFETIVYAVRQGRVIFSNIRKFVIYLLSCNISEVFVIGLAAIFSSHLPITPLQILFLNLVTDVFPALALGMGKGDESYLDQPPRRYDEKILERHHWRFIFFYGALITGIVLSIFYLLLFHFKVPIEKAVTLSFLILGMSQLFHVFNLRKRTSKVLVNDITTNPFVWAAVCLCILIFVASIHIPIIQEALNLVPLNWSEWLFVIAAGMISWVGQFFVTLK